MSFPAGAPAAYESGDTRRLRPVVARDDRGGDLQDTEVEVLLGDEVLGTFPVTNTLQDVPFDEAGTASVSVTLPTVGDGTTVFTCGARSPAPR